MAISFVILVESVVLVSVVLVVECILQYKFQKEFEKVIKYLSSTYRNQVFSTYGKY